MPTSARNAAERKARPDLDWRSDYERITGEPYSVASFMSRLHPRDTARVWRAIITSVRTGRFDEEYHLRNRHGRYILVHGATRRIGKVHVGIIEVIGDIAWPDFCRYVIRIRPN